MKKNLKNKKNGFTLIEIVVAVTIITITMFVLINTAEKGVNLSNNALKKSQASFLLEEGVEATKSIRDNNWLDISSLEYEIPYYLYFDNTLLKWKLDTNINLTTYNTVYPIDNLFYRSIIISPVYRDINDDIVFTGGSLDNRTKKITVNVYWTFQNKLNTNSIEYFVSDIFN